MITILLSLALWSIFAVGTSAVGELHAGVADSFIVSTPAFPFYSSYAGKPYTVSYDKRSLRLNDEPVLFMSGSIHYPRSTPAMWPILMNAAREDGINMIEIYVFWNGHEPVEGELDWSGRYNLTLFLDAIAEAGLFANLRIGPYVCAEWDYGGIPVWLSFKEGIRMRSYNQIWRDAVQKWVTTVIDQTRNYFADRGGPIVLAQIENELGNNADPRYVQWNGDMANAFNVGVPWIMCNGVSAKNTINTCNGNDCAGFLEQNGQSGRILIDQPGLWTENEGWFQEWSQPTYPGMGDHSDRTPEDISYTVARWFARGGSHMNYVTLNAHLHLNNIAAYMYHGGNNYERTYAAGVTTKYADGVNFHCDGLPNEPKKSHLQSLHLAVAAVSADLVAHPAQYKAGVPLQWRHHSTDPWSNGTQQVAFVYGATVFLESSGPDFVQVLYNGAAWSLSMQSILILQNGQVIWNSSHVLPATVQRVNKPVWSKATSWSVWLEGPYSALSDDGAIPAFWYDRPVEQLNLTRDLTDYCWYTTTATIPSAQSNATMRIQTGTGQSFLVFLDGQFMGSCFYPTHNWPFTSHWDCVVPVGAVQSGKRELSLLSVSLGIENGMDAEEIPYNNHYKGIRTGGSVMLGSQDVTTGGWTLRPYLTGQWLELWTAAGQGSVPWSSDWKAVSGHSLTWYRTTFPRVSLPSTGLYAVLLDLTGMGRGHAFVNGHDIGHYWLIEGGTTGYPTQWLYHVPQDWLVDGDNTLTLIEELGGDPAKVQVVISQMLPKQETAGHHNTVGVQLE